MKKLIALMVLSMAACGKTQCKEKVHVINAYWVSYGACQYELMYLNQVSYNWSNNPRVCNTMIRLIGNWYPVR